MSSHEIANRSALRDLISSLTSWQTWTGLDATASKSRISWPNLTVDALPCIVIVTLAGGRRNPWGSDSSANFRSKGGLGILVFDEVSNPDDLFASDTAFGTKFFGLLDDLVDKAHSTSLMIEQIEYGDNPYTLGAVNSATAEDADEDDEDDDAAVEKKIWTGIFQIYTGVA